MIEQREVLPIMAKKARDIILSPIALGREIHQFASKYNRIARAEWGVNKTIVAEIVVITPPHLVIAGLIMSNDLLSACAACLTLAEVASVVLARVSNPELYREILEDRSI